MVKHHLIDKECRVTRAAIKFASFRVRQDLAGVTNYFVEARVLAGLRRHLAADGVTMAALAGVKPEEWRKMEVDGCWATRLNLLAYRLILHSMGNLLEGVVCSTGALQEYIEQIWEATAGGEG